MSWHRLGEQIRALRQKRGLTRKALAAQTGLSEIFVRKVEEGTRMPSFPSLERIAGALEVALHVELVERRVRRARGG